MRLKNKVALISGGASGIGAAAAKRFLQEGAKVVIGDINLEKGQDIVKGLKDEGLNDISFIKLDVREEADWHRSVKRTEQTFGPLNVLVNSAGVSIPGSIEDISLADFHATLSINLDGTFLGCKTGLAAMKSNPKSSIINVASTLGHRGGSIFTAYNASKAAVIILTRSIALHCSENKYDVRVNTISPGAIHTEMVEKYIQMGISAGGKTEDVVEEFAETHPMKRLGRPDEPANAIVFLASDESSFSTGIDIPVDGGFLA